ncbi:AAA family ATPase [Cupriavidus oxalaticus]|uniref:Protein CR006 P-loop domain-containing protein n=1 Tax=Cupriavidus oxalaticus TaxID=96344 RepID=A0A5P3VSP6_9BURK|nr:AAA family ATPase [Cupriavidus oxalaticus]QEZ48995.1 hypothetical protein D2917_32615 [Cupriavidus oxalaticus]
MLKQIQAIHGVGLFLEAGPSPELERVALFYGENGRGKSTLASILRSCAENSTATISSRKTLDAVVKQLVKISHLDEAGATINAHYEPESAADWTHGVPNLRVFDAEFVSRNVYSGTEINTDQRASLLEFALGEEAVALREKLDAATKHVNEVTTKIMAQTNVVKVHAGPLAVDAFAKLPDAPNADAEIDALMKRITAAQNRDTHMKRPAPNLVDLPTFDPAALFDILKKSLDDIEAEAEAAVRAHVDQCRHQDFEGWLSQGQSFDTGENCPYCGSDIRDNTLIKTYRTFFNTEYNGLKRNVAKLEQGLQRRLGDEIVEAVTNAFALSQAKADAWKDYVKFAPIGFDTAGMKGKLAELRGKLVPLLKAKTAQPLERVGSEMDLAEAIDLWKEAIVYVEAANKQVNACIVEIDAYKKGLAAEDAAQLRKSVDALNLRKLRHTAAVKADVEQLTKLTGSKKSFTDQKDAVRAELDALMTATLTTYQTEINTLLAAFGSQARIDALKFDYRGSGVPRSDYRLRVRGQEVRLAGDSGAAFGNTLSEGDKRALAFAFFVARLHKDPKLSSRLVVIDDPMCSLDRRRRSETIRILKVLAAQCRQLIVLAHDSYFLRDLDEAVGKVLEKLPGKPRRSYCKVVTVAGQYSSFDVLNLADECASDYERDLEAIVGFADGKPGHDRLHVATRLRVLIEANLHRQFPHAIERGKMLGQVIEGIAKAQTPSPLAALQSSVMELRALNDYAKQFHHAEDGTPPDFSALDEGELRAYCTRALAFILRGTA